MGAMNVWDWFRAIFNPYKESSSQERAIQSSPVPDPRPIPSGRASVDDVGSNLSSNWVIQQPSDSESFWRLRNLDYATLTNATPKELLDMLIDLSPELSRAVWDFLRLCNPGYEYKAFNLDESGSLSEEGMFHLNDFFHRLREKHGSVDVVLGRFFMGAYLRGAFCAELVLDSSARESLDLATPDPYSIRFRKRADALLKQVWQPGQFQGNQFVSLDIPTFRYLPVDPAPASPYGRPLASPALFTSIFLLSLLHDVKRVVMQQGYKRMDISLSTEQAMDSFSYDPQGFASLGEYMRGAVEAIRDAYGALEPDDAFIHTDLFTLGVPAGTVDSDSIAAISTLIERLEKMATRALKSNGLIMGTDASGNETDSNRRWEIHVAGVKSLQHHCENMLESLLSLSLQAKGIQARVQFRFAELRAAEMLRDEQTRMLRVQNAILEYQAGFISQDEAANNAVNHDADAPGPRTETTPLEMTDDNSDGNENLNQGSDRLALDTEPEFDTLWRVNGHS